MMQKLMAVPRPGRMGKRPVSIWEALVWAFQIERVSLDFDEIATVSGDRPGVGMEYILLQRHNLGASVDGGGRSEPHPDAELIASALAHLPEHCGGRRRALWIAELARAGQWPDPGADEGARCEPIGWTRCKAGLVARREFWRGPGRWPPSVLRRSSAYADGYVCRVRFSGTAADVAAARRAWLQWRGALQELRATFQRHSTLTGFAITDVLPPRDPWGLDT